MATLKHGPPALVAALSKVLAGSYDVPELTLPSEPVIIDIGANIGAAAARFHELWPAASIACYEPHPRNFEALTENVSSYAFCVQAAVSDHAGTSPLYQGLCNEGEHSLYPKLAGTETVAARVDVVSAADLPECDVLKIDTEGSELPILRSYRHLGDCTAVLLEWHSQADRQAIHELLEPLGFVCYSEVLSPTSPDREMKFVHKRTGLQPKPVEKPPHLFLGVPGWKLSPFHAASREQLVLACQQYGIELTIRPEFAAGIERSRNISVAAFREINADVLGFVDSDISFDPSAVITIVNMLMSGKMDVVGGMYPKKGINYDKLEKAIKAGVPTEQLRYHANDCVGNAMSPDANGQMPGVQSPDAMHRFMEIDELGTGFLFIHRRAVERFIAHHRTRIEYETDYGVHGATHHILFLHERDSRAERQMAAEDLLSTVERGGCVLREQVERYAAACKDPKTAGRYLTEDYSFTVRWKQMDGCACDACKGLPAKAYAYLDANFAHQGPWLFEGRAAVDMPRQPSVEAAQ